jgi:hypothetical protein
MNETWEGVLIAALDLLERGLGVDEIVARYPAQAAQLRPFMMTAVALSNLSTQPTVSAEQKSRRAFLAAADRLAAQKARPAVGAVNWLRRLTAPALALVVALLIGGAGLAGASGSAAPGDALYETKLFFEETRLSLTGNPERAALLREQFELERVREIKQLLAEGAQADVSLTGEIEAMVADLWTVAGVPVDVSAAAIDGTPVVGALVRIDGQTANGFLRAARVTVLAGQLPGPVDDSPPDVLPLATDQPTPSPTSTVAPTPDAVNANDNGAANVNDNGDDNVNDNFVDNVNANDNDNDNDDDDANDNVDDNGNDNDDDDNVNDNDGDDDNDNDDNANDNVDDNANDNDDDDNDNGDDNVNDNGGDNGNDNGDDDDDNANDNGGDNGNDNGDDDNANDNNDDNVNDNGGDNDDDDNANDNNDDNGNDNGDNSGSGNNDDDDNSGSGNGGDNDNGD